MIRFRRDDILQTLTRHDTPFTLLSEERRAEAGDVVRFIELRKDELFQLRCSESHDCLYLIEGSVDVIHSDAINQIAGPEATRTRPYILPAAPHRCTVLAREDAVVCHADRELLTGNRSAVAAMPLRQRHIDAVSLGGGIRDWPYETTDIYSEVTTA